MHLNKLQNNFANSGPVKTPASASPKSTRFCGAFGQFLNKELHQQGDEFRRKVSPEIKAHQLSVQKLIELIKESFPKLKVNVLDLGEQKALKLPNHLNLFTATDFSKTRPQTDLYIDFDRVKRIKNNNQTAEFTYSLNYKILNLADIDFAEDRAQELGQKLGNLSEIRPSGVKVAISGLNKLYGMEIDCEIADKAKIRLVDSKGNPVITNNQITENVLSNHNIKSRMFLDFDRPKEDTLNFAVHEYSHVLQANTPATQTDLVLGRINRNIPAAWDKFEDSIIKININNGYNKEKEQISRVLDCAQRLGKQDPLGETFKGYFTSADKKEVYTALISDCLKQDTSMKRDHLLIYLINNCQKEAQSYKLGQAAFKRLTGDEDKILFYDIYPKMYQDVADFLIETRLNNPNL